MIRLSYLYRVRNLVNGKMFYGIHSSVDPSFASPPVRLSDLRRMPGSIASDRSSVLYDTLPEFTNKSLAHDLKSIGEHNFVIESLYASPLKDDVERMFKQYVTETFMKSSIAYNALPQVHRCTSEDNPMYDEQTRKKMSAIIKAKTIVRDSKGRIKKIIPAGACSECKLVDAHKISCSFYGK